MWPDSPFAEARGSFVVPVEPPTVEPTTGPTETITVSCAWLPFIRGALKQLLLQTSWATDVVDLDTTQGRVFNLIDLFQECGGTPFPAACPFDFRGIDGQGWVNPTSYYANSGPVGHFVPLVGFVGDSGYQTGSPDYWMQCIVKKTYSAPFDVHEVTVIYDLAFGSDYGGELSGGNNFGVELYNGGTLVASAYTDHAHTLTGTDQIFSHDFGGVTADEVQIFNLAGVTQNSPADGQVTVTQIQFTYTGTVPGGC